MEQYGSEGQRQVDRIAFRPDTSDTYTDRAERIRERTRDLLDEIASVDVVSPTRYVEIVADEIARYVLELDESGAARGLRSLLIRRLLGDKGPMPGEVMPMPGGRICAERSPHTSTVQCELGRGHSGTHYVRGYTW